LKLLGLVNSHIIVFLSVPDPMNVSSGSKSFVTETSIYPGFGSWRAWQATGILQCIIDRFWDVFVIDEHEASGLDRFRTNLFTHQTTNSTIVVYQ
jgi:hypothetical protein